MKKITFFRNLIVLVALLIGSGSAMGQYSGTGTFTKITSLVDLTDGYYVVVNSGDAFAMNNTNAGSYFEHTAISPSAGTITNPAAAIVWKIETNGEGRTIFNEASSKYVSYTGSSNASYAVDAVTADNQRWTFSYASNLFSVANVAIPSRILQYNAGAPRFACYTSAQQKFLLYKLAVSEDPDAVSTPTFSPTSGNYLTTQNVTISTSTEGATIYYTTDGSDPDNTDTEYTTPIAVSATTTVKAIAYKTDMDPSAIASATYTFPTEVANIAALRAGTTGSTVYKLTGEAVMTLKSSNNNVKYIQDATGGILIYDASGIITTAYNVNDGITGITGTLNLFSGMLQFIPVTDPGAATSTNNTVTPVEATLTNYGNYPGQLVKITGLTIAETGSFAASTNYTLSDGTNSGVLRTAYSDLPYVGSAIPTVPQDIVGVVLMYNSTAQLVPRTADDFSNTIIESPSIFVAEVDVPAMSAYVDASDSETITVNGVNLTENITLTLGGDNASQFRLSTSTLTQTGGSVTDASVTIYYEPKAVGSHTATVTLSSNGATDVTRTLNGEVIEPITAPNVIITEVYGGGGNSGATYTHDFFELYNTTENSVTIGGWSIQYYAATGTGASSNVIVIPDGKYIPAKSHFLIQSASGGAVGVALPTPDATGTVNAAAAAGKVILYTTNAAQTINSSDITSITGNGFFKDYVPFGTTATPVWGSAMSSGASNTTSATRKKVEGEYVYTQNIGNDFEVASPNPQNTGIVSSTDNPSSLTNIYAHNAKIHFTATAGEKVEVYNAVGQKIISTLATDGQNELPVNAKGVMIVKVGSRLAKVIL